jgi:hypothetical protein
VRQESYFSRKTKTTPALLAVAIVLLCGAPFHASAQSFAWNDFECRTLSQLIKINNDEDADDLKRFPDKGQMVMRGKILPSVVRVTYTSESRPISAEHQKFIELWADVYSEQKQVYAKRFESEFLFTEGPEQYWLPVQGPVAKYLNKELQKGDAVDLYLVRPGGMRIKEKVDWIFLVEEFQKPKE